MRSVSLSGGCACGAIRYQVTSQPFDAGYCHCTTCRRVSGAPVLAFASTPRAGFTFTQGAPVRRRSSRFGERTFCGACGAQLTMQVDHQPETIDFTLATLDDAAAVVPQFHLWTESRIPWFEISDNLPRYGRSRPHTAGT